MFDEIDGQLAVETYQLADEVINLNMYMLISSITIFAVFCALIAPTLRDWRSKTVRILTIVARITQEEAELEIELLKKANNLLTSDTLGKRRGGGRRISYQGNLCFPFLPQST